MADENNSNEDGQFVPDGSMEPLSPQEADNTDYGLMVGERIQKKDLQQEMRDSYLAYAMSVIVDRALPDVRDGMKPVHRRGYGHQHSSAQHARSGRRRALGA